MMKMKTFSKISLKLMKIKKISKISLKLMKIKIFSKILLVNLGFGALCNKKLLEIKLFLTPPSEFLQILAFYCIFVHQFLAKTLNFLKKHALFGKKFEEFALKVMKIKRFSKILLVNLGFGRSVTKSCWNSSFFCPPCEKCKKIRFYSIFEHQFLGILV